MWVNEKFYPVGLQLKNQNIALYELKRNKHLLISGFFPFFFNFFFLSLFLRKSKGSLCISSSFRHKVEKNYIIQTLRFSCFGSFYSDSFTSITKSDFDAKAEICTSTVGHVKLNVSDEDKCKSHLAIESDSQTLVGKSGNGGRQHRYSELDSAPCLWSQVYLQMAPQTLLSLA